MLQQWTPYFSGATAVYCWLIAGVFLTFSDFVMRSLGAIRIAEGISAMQSINILVYRSVFMVGLFSVSAMSLGFIAIGLINGGEGAGLRIAGGIIYLVTVMGVSFIGNIPLNKKLAVVDPSDPASEALWQHYLRVWVNWNHIRTAGASIAAMLLTVAAFQ